MKFERDSYWRTRDGRNAKVLAVNLKGAWPIAIITEDNYLYRIKESGQGQVNTQSAYELIEEDSVKVVGWERIPGLDQEIE